MDGPNTDELIGYQPPQQSNQSYKQFKQSQEPGPNFSIYPRPYVEYNNNYNTGFNKYTYDYHYDYDPYGRDYRNDSIKSDFVDFGFQFFLIVLSIFIPYTFYLIKRTLLRFRLLSPRVDAVLNRLQSIFQRTTASIARKLVRRRTGSDVSLNKEATNVITENITDHLNEKLNKQIAKLQDNTEHLPKIDHIEQNKPSDDIIPVNIEVHPVTGEPIIRH